MTYFGHGGIESFEFWFWYTVWIPGEIWKICLHSPIDTMYILRSEIGKKQENKRNEKYKIYIKH